MARTPALLPLALSALLLAGCATPPTVRPPLRLTVLHTNDHHGRFWPNADGEYGLAARKTLVDRIRAEVAAAGGQLLLLDGGDVNTGVPESDLQQAEPDFTGMNALGYDAMAVGNHEFDKPPAVLAQQRQWARFPLLSANIVRDDGTHAFEPYRIFERGGYRIAVIGLTTDDTPRLVQPDHVRGLQFRAPAAAAAALLPALRRQADMVIAATHMGHYPDGRHGVNAPGDVEMARALAAQGRPLDLIVGGHSQNPVCMAAENRRDEAYVPGQPCAPDRQGGTWIVQAHEWGKYLGRADFVIDAGRVELLRYQLLPVNLKRTDADGVKRQRFAEAVPEDPALRARLEPFQRSGEARLLQPVGSADGVLDGDRARVRQQPTTLGTLIARAMMARTGADLALVNSGGVRDSLPAGTITMRDVLKAQPFGNTVAVVELGGDELWAFLQAAARITPGAGGFPQTAGVQLLIEGGALREARIGGQPLQPQRRYRLALPAFVAAGGDGYPRLKDHPGYTDSGFSDAEVLRAYIAGHSPLRPADYEPRDAVTRR